VADDEAAQVACKQLAEFLHVSAVWIRPLSLLPALDLVLHSDLSALISHSTYVNYKE
jgi:hypothetical protein